MSIYEYSLTANETIDYTLSKKPFDEYVDYYSSIETNYNVEESSLNAIENVYGHANINAQSTNPKDLFESGGDYYAYADKYGVPHAYTGNAASLSASFATGEYKQKTGTIAQIYEPLYYVSSSGSTPTYLYSIEGTKYYEKYINDDGLEAYRTIDLPDHTLLFTPLYVLLSRKVVLLDVRR